MNIKRIILFVSFILLAVTAEYCNIIGTLDIFGKTNPVILISISLAIAKYVIAIALQFPNENKLLKIYMYISMFVLLLITSFGIYSYLSTSYHNIKEQYIYDVESKKNIETKLNYYNEQVFRLERYRKKADSININNTQLNLKYSNQYDNQIENLSDSVFFYKEKLNIVPSKHLGSLQNIHNITNIDIDLIANSISGLLTVTLDPLAMILLLMFLKSENKNGIKQRKNSRKL